MSGETLWVGVWKRVMSSGSPSPEPRFDILEWLEAVDSDAIDDQFLSSSLDSNPYPLWDPLPSPPAEIPPTSFSAESQQKEKPAKRSRRDGSSSGTSVPTGSAERRRKGSAKSLFPSPAGRQSRWAERLLNSCAAAIESRNSARVQHLLYVLRELSSVCGDPNQRLASHGLLALTRELNGGPVPSPCSAFASVDPRIFHRALVTFHERSPWFAFSYTLANAVLLEAIAASGAGTPAHIIDVGVSHGVQWPTLIESLARRPGGPPSLLRLTIVTDVTGAPFSTGPTGDDYPARLERFANSVHVRLQVKIVRKELPTLTGEDLRMRNGERLAICIQFRLHQLNEEERKSFLRFITSLRPEVVILSDTDVAGEDRSGEEFADRFGRRAELLWRFLDSTAAAFKGRDCEERKLVEAEAGLTLVRGGWEEMSMRSMKEAEEEAGLVSVELGEGMVESGRAMLKKHDANWEMKMADIRGGCPLLCWKRQPVSFCSVWKPRSDA